MISILYVDDEKDLLLVAQKILELTGEFCVTTMTSAKAALSSSIIPTFDAIISDYQMPEMDGILFLKAVREQYGDIPFILFTGRGREEVVIEAIDSGADFYVQKGGSPQAQFAELSHKIKQVVRRKEAERSNLDTKRRLSDIINFLPDATFAIDSSGRVIAWNRAIEEMTGILSEDMLGKGDYEYALSFYGSRRPLLIDLINEPVEKISLWYPQVAYDNDALTIETSLPTPKGVQMHAVAKASPLYNQDGQKVGAIESVRDITNRKKVEENLIASEQRYRELAELLPQIVFELDINFQITYGNQHAKSVFGYTDEDIALGISALSLIVPEQQPRVIEVVRKMMAGDTVAPQEYSAQKKDGSFFPIIIYSAPIVRNDTIVGFRGVIVDISSRKEFEKQLEQSENKFRSIFELSPYPISINNEADGSFVQVNTAFLQKSGYSAEEILNKNPVELGIVSPDDYAGIVQQLDLSVKIENVPLSLNARDGRQVYGLSSIIRLVINDKPHTLSITADITQLKESEEELIRKNEELHGAFEELSAVEEELRQNYSELSSQEKALGQTTNILRESEHKWATIFENSPVAFSLVSVSDGVFSDVNRSFCRLTGYSRDEVIGTTSEKLSLFADNGQYQQLLASLQQNGSVYGREVLCRNKAGQIQNCLFSSSIILMGNKPHILSTIQDITQKKDDESSFQAMVRMIVGETGIHSLDMITTAICSWLNADGVMIGELSSDRKTVHVLSMFLDGKEVENYSYTLKATPCEKVVTSGFSLYLKDVIAMFPECTDFSDMGIQGYIGTPLHNSAGEVFGVICVFSRRLMHPPPSVKEMMDIIAVKVSAEIERSQIERELAYNEGLLAEAMDLAHMVNWEYGILADEFTFDDRFYALYGTTTEQEGGSHMSAHEYTIRFVHPEDYAIVGKEIKKALETTDPKFRSYLEHRIIRRDGEIRHIAVRVGAVFDTLGNTVKTYGANQDITSRRRAEEALRKANRQLNLLTGITRHDILNKIMVILSYLELARTEFSDIVLNEYFDALEQATNTIRSQIEFTRVYQDLGTHEPGWVNLGDIMPQSDIPAEISFTADVDGIMVYADPMVKTVFFNLLDNSIRHGEHVTWISVSAMHVRDTLVIVWEDNGVGIEQSDKEKIFERGYGKNTGLGMFLAREILALTDISIIESGIAGKGARFEMVVLKNGWKVITS